MSMLLRRCGLVLAGVLIVKLHTHWMYFMNPRHESENNMGGIAVNTFHANIRSLASVIQWPRYASVFAYLWIAVWAGWTRLSSKPLRQLYWVCPLWLIGMMIVGRIGEIRIFNELTPMVVVSVAVILHHLMFGDGEASCSGAPDGSLPE
jgi:hypothetical protein